MKNGYRELYDAAWRVSVDARERVRGQAAEVFGKDAEWTRSFDFQRPVEGYGSIKGFRFMNDGENNRMFVIRHDGNFELLPDRPDEKFVSRMMSELEQAKLNPTRICGWYDSETAAREERRLNHHNTNPASRSTVTEVCPGFFFVHHDDFSACLKNSSNQRIDCPIMHNEFITDFRYAGSLDGMEHFAYEAVPDYGGQTIYGLFDVNGRESYFPHINEYDNRDRLVPAVCKAFQEMVKEREMAEGKGLGRSDGRGGDREMGQANEAKAEKDLGERRGLRM